MGEPLAVVHGERQEGRREGGAVGERQPVLVARRGNLLRPEILPQMVETAPQLAGLLEKIGNEVARLAHHVVAALPQQHHEELGERAEVAARPHRAADGHQRHDPPVEHRLHREHHLAADPRVPLQEGVEPDGERRPHHVRLEVVGRIAGVGRLPHAHGVAEQDVTLQLLQAVGRDGDVLELAEAGGDAVFEHRPPPRPSSTPRRTGPRCPRSAPGSPRRAPRPPDRSPPAPAGRGRAGRGPRASASRRRERRSFRPSLLGERGAGAVRAHRRCASIGSSISRIVAASSARGTSRCPGRSSSHSWRLASASARRRPASMSLTVTIPFSFSFEP